MVGLLLSVPIAVHHRHRPHHRAGLLSVLPIGNLNVRILVRILDILLLPVRSSGHFLTGGRVLPEDKPRIRELQN